MENGSVIEFSILFAIVVYGMVAMLISALVSFLDRKIAEERSKARYVAQEQERRPGSGPCCQRARDHCPTPGSARGGGPTTSGAANSCSGAHRRGG